VLDSRQLPGASPPRNLCLEPPLVSSLAGFGSSDRRHLCLAELAAVGRISDELMFAGDAAFDAVPSRGAGNDKFPVLRRRLVGALATFAFLPAARLLS